MIPEMGGFNKLSYSQFAVLTCIFHLTKFVQASFSNLYLREYAIRIGIIGMIPEMGCFNKLSYSQFAMLTCIFYLIQLVQASLSKLD